MTVQELYRKDGFPVFQNRMYESREAAQSCPRGDIRLVEDLRTGLVFNRAFRSEDVVYDSNYQNEQGLSAAFKAHLARVADRIDATMGTGSLVEVGCGKGAFLEMLMARGRDVRGFDPTYEGNNPRIERTLFSPDAGMSADGLILRHVLEHIADPLDFLRQLAIANGGKGLIYIEVPCFDWICRERAWFDIFYEHVNYFRLSDFHRLFARVLHAERTFDGQYLSVVADLSTLRTPVRDPQDAADFPKDFLDRLTKDTSAANGPSVIWGGASKGVIYALMRARMGHPVTHVVDINPAKQGRFLAGTGLRVLSPSEALDNLPEGTPIHVMNPNYLDAVRAMAGPRFPCKGLNDD